MRWILKRCRAIAVSIASVLAGAAADADPRSTRVDAWTPAGVSSEQFESHAAFDPITDEMLFVRSDATFHGWRLLTATCGKRGWTAPLTPSFAAPGLEADPYFTPDGRSLFFISTRASASQATRDLDIWRIDRDAAGRWGEPLRLPAPVNSPEAEWFPRLARDGWLYFGSKHSGGLGKNDIWRARVGKIGVWSVENLGPSVNTAGQEYEAEPSPDGKSLIITTDTGLYLTRRTARGWGARVKLGPAINHDSGEVGPLFSPSGRSMLFARDIGAGRSGEFFVWRVRDREHWPRLCQGK